MKKNQRMEEEEAAVALEAGATGMHPCVYGYVRHFNLCEYYEAHDILEHLWLRGPGADYAYFKGLIQIAGAYVHLRLHYLRPVHYKHRGRLRPAVRLFELGIANVTPFPEGHHLLPVGELIRRCREDADAVRAGDFKVNPWRPEHALQLHLPRPGGSLTEPLGEE